MLDADMQRIVREQRLGFVATVNEDGTPNLSPKGTFVVLDPRAIAFGDIRSPGTLRNLRARPALEVNFVDPFARKGWRFAGRAQVWERGTAEFAGAVGAFAQYGALVERFRGIVRIEVTRALPLASPAYDDGTEEQELRRSWTRHFRGLQPGGRFPEE